MNLHRSDNQPEWATVPKEEWNLWQQLAGATSGLATIGNIVTIGGFVSVLAGLHDMYTGSKQSGFIKIAAGRVADLVDGVAANRTGTKSPLGEGLDATADKISMLLALPILAKSGELPVPAAAALVARDVAFAGVATIAKQRGAELHPGAHGKRATFEQWLSLSFYAGSNMAAEAGHDGIARSLQYLGHTAFGVMAIESGLAFSEYAQQTFSPVPVPVKE